MLKTTEVLVKSTCEVHNFYDVLHIEFLSAREMKKMGHDTNGHPYFACVIVPNEFTEGIERYYFPVDDIEISFEVK